MTKVLMKFKFKEIEYDGIKYISPSWEEMGELTFSLAKTIIGKNKKYDRVVALAKGGWTWARSLVDYLKIENLSSIHIKFYNGVYSTNVKPEIIEPLTVSVKGEKILLFDDVVDSGKTVPLVMRLVSGDDPKLVDTASLFYKPHSVYKPNFYSYTTSAWVIFPHEVRELIELSNNNWKKKGLSQKEIETRLLKLKLPKEQVEYFLNKT